MIKIKTITKRTNTVSFYDCGMGLTQLINRLLRIIQINGLDVKLLNIRNDERNSEGGGNLEIFFPTTADNVITQIKNWNATSVSFGFKYKEVQITIGINAQNCQIGIVANYQNAALIDEIAEMFS